MFRFRKKGYGDYVDIANDYIIVYILYPCRNFCFAIALECGVLPLRWAA